MNKKSSSIKTRISILFIILMIVTITIIGAISFYSWRTSIDNMITQIQNDAHVEITDQVGKFINIPLYINDMNHHIFEHQIVDVYNDKSRERYFAGVMKATQEDVYSFSYGTEQGEYYGARRNPNNQIEIMRSDAQTGGQSQYYSVKPDLTAGEVVVKLGDFDPRTRDWYQIAKKKGKPVFSDIYRHFMMNDLALSASYPIYDQEDRLKGILGTHLLLSHINEFLQDSVKDKQNIAYIVERQSGDLVANSLGNPNFRMDADGTMNRISIEEFNNKPILEAYQNYKKSMQEEYVLSDIINGKTYVKISEFRKEGLDWLIITAISEKFYTGEINRSIYLSIILSVLALLIAIFIWTKRISSYLKPIYSLINTTEHFSRGEFSKRAEFFRNDEIGKLACAFNDMAQELCLLFNNLEDKVIQRTKQLELMNHQLIQTKEQLEKSSQTDFLTNLYNRRFMLENIEQEIRRFQRTKKEFSIVMADIDYFKKVNDTYGHDGGDLVLKEVAITIQHLARTTDCISRWGGEEFLLMLPETDLDGALQIAERIRRTIENREFLYQNDLIKVTMTLGVAVYKGDRTIDEVIKNADIAVYRGKQEGRNRVAY